MIWTEEYKKEYMKIYSEKYRNDPENKKRILQRAKEYGEKNKEKIAKYKKENRLHLNKKAAEWRKRSPKFKANREKTKNVTTSGRLKRQYGITLEDYNDLLVVQNYKCAICPKSHSESLHGLHIDHCHKTKKVRGLLCMQCNTVLGKVNDNIKILENAITYLKSHNEDF